MIPPVEPAERFTAAFEAHYGNVRAYCVSRLRHRGAADDAAAEVFTAAWRRIDAMPTEPETRPWLFGVARNVVRNSSRARRRHLRLVDRLTGTRADAEPEPQLSMDPEVIDALHRLDDADIELLTLSAWHEFTPAEIAVVLDITANAARIRLHRARRRLADEFGDSPRDDAKRSTTTGHDRAPMTSHEEEHTA